MSTLVKTSPNRTPVSSDEYRDNYDRIFSRGPVVRDETKDDGTRTITIVPAQYLAGWNDAIDAVSKLEDFGFDELQALKR